MAQIRNNTILNTGLRLDGVFGTYCGTGSLSETITISMSLASPRTLWAASRENSGDHAFRLGRVRKIWVT